MHVLVLPSNYPNPYHPEKTSFFRDHARMPAERGHTVGLVALTGVSLRAVVRQRRWAFGLVRFPEAGFETWRYTYPVPPRNRPLDRAVRRVLSGRLAGRYLAHKGTPDLIHAHGGPAAESARWWHRRTGAPFVVTLHAQEFYGRGAERRIRPLLPALARASLRLAVSPGYAAHLEGLTGLPFHALPNPVDTAFFRPPPEPHPEDRPFTFVSIAALDRNKNHALLVAAFAERFGGDPGYRLVIGGSGPERPRLAALIAERGVADQVTLTGQLDRAGVRDRLWAADAFVLTSRRETFGVVLVEALACGVPIVATRSDGPEAVIRDVGLGALAEHDPADLGRAMARVAAGGYDAERLRAEAVARYGLEAVAARLDALYEAALNGGDHGP